MDMRELALTEAAYGALGKTIDAGRDTVRKQMQTALETSGAKAVDAALPDGTKVASVYVSGAKAPTAVVSDSGEFLAWVREHAPDEVVSYVVTEVRPSYRKKLLAEMTKAARPEVVDTVTGAITAVDGVTITPAMDPTTHSVRMSDGGMDAIAQAWAAGGLAHLRMLPQLAPPVADTEQPGDEREQSADDVDEAPAGGGE